MSDSLNLEIIEQKIDSVAELIEQQGKSGVFFDSFTKQILEKIHLKLEDISNFETNELISYLTSELKKELEERHSYIEQRLTGVHGQLQVVQANLADSIKTPEVSQVFSQLSDNLMAFSRDLGTQTRYFNNAIAEVRDMVNQNNFDLKLAEQTNVLKTDLNTQKTALENGLEDMQNGFQKLLRLVEANAPFEALNSLGSEVAVLQTSLVNLVAAVSGINNKQAAILEELAVILTREDFEPSKEEISSILTQTIALNESLKLIANKTDIKNLEEKLAYTVEMVSNIRDVANLSNDEHKNLLNAYFTNLYNLISTLITKEDGSKIKEDFEKLKLVVENNGANFEEVFSVTQNDIKSIIPVLSTLATQGNLKELSQYAVDGLEKLNNEIILNLNGARQFTEEKIDSLKENLSSIYTSLEELSTNLNNTHSENTSYMRIELTRIYDLVDDFREKLSAISRDSFDTISSTLRDNSVIIVDKIEALETAVNTSQETLEENLSGNISQLKEFSQSIVNSLQEIISTAEDNRMGILNTVSDNQTSLLARINVLSEAYLASGMENKTEIIEQINTLKELVQTAHGLLEDKSGFEMVSEKVQNIETILENYKQAVLLSDNQLHQAFLEQNKTLESVKENVQALAFKLAALNDTGLETKTEITNLLADKFTLLNSSLESVFEGLKSNSGENKSSLIEEISKISKETEELKTLINETAENQASKQVLGIIFENITKKLSEVTVIFDESKTFTLEVYDGLKGLITGLKEELSNVSGLIDRSDEFATDVKNNIDATLAQLSIDTVQKIERLKDYLKEISSDNKSELLSEIENIGEKFLLLENSVGELKLDELIKEGLSELKNQIEDFNEKSLSDLLETISNDNAQTSETIRETVLGLGSNFDDVLFKIGKIEEKAFNASSAIEVKLSENFEILSEKVSIVSNNLQNNSYRNKDEIISEIANLKDSFEDIKESVSSIGAKILDDEYFSAKIDKISEELNSISDKTCGELEISLKNSYDGVIEGIKNAFEIIKEDIEETISNLKVSNTSLEERLGEIKDKISYEIDEIKAIVEENSSSFETSAQQIKSFVGNGFDVVGDRMSALGSIQNSAKSEIIEGLSASIENIADKIELAEEKREEIKSEILAEITKSFQAVNQHLESSNGLNTEFREELRFEFKKSIDEIAEKLFRAGDDNLNLKSELSGEIQKSYNAIVARISEQEGVSDEYIADIKNLLSEQFKFVSENLEDKFASINTQVEYLDEEIKTAIKSEAQRLLNSFNKSLEDVEENVLLKLNEDKLSGLKSEISEKFELLFDKLGENENTENLEEKLGELKESIKALDNTDEIKELFDEITQKLLSQDNSVVTKVALENLTAEITDKISALTEIADKNKSELTGKISEISSEVSEKINFVIDEVISTITKDIEDGLEHNVSAVSQAVEDKISYLKDDLSDVILKISQLDSLSDNLKDTLIDEFDEYRNDINDGLAALGEEVRKYLADNSSAIKDRIEAVKDDTALIKELMEKYKEGLDTISDIDLGAYHNDIKKVINKEIDGLKKDFEQKLTTLFETDEANIVQEKLSEVSDNIKNQIENLKEIILSIEPEKSDWEEKLAEKFGHAQDEITSSINSLLSQNQDIIDIVKSETASIKDIIAKYQKEIENISDIDFSSFQNESQDFVRNELKQLKEQFIVNLTSVFENISFIEEAQEIQDAIYDNADEIKEEINKLKQAVISNSNSSAGVDEKFDKLKDLLSESIKNDLKVLTTSSENSSDYLYTLPDVEIDLAKMRLAINDISNLVKKSKEDEVDYSLDLKEQLESISGIRDDISSISKRTNKLILTSEDANKNLKEHLEDLKAATVYITQKCEMLDNSDIEHNVRDIKSLVMSSLKADKVLNEAFMFLAEWIDNTAVGINKINENVLEFKRDTKLVDEISDMKELLASGAQSGVEEKLEEILRRFDEQENKIKELEKKIETAPKTSGADGEIHSVLEFIASQASAANENSRNCKLLLDKIELMEHKMSKLETGISKLTSLIDEE